MYNQEVSRSDLAFTGQLDVAIKAQDEFDKTSNASGSEEKIGTDEDSTIDKNSQSSERFQVNRRSFHIFEASPLAPDHSCAKLADESVPAK